MSNKSNKGIMVLLIILILLVIGVGGILVYDKIIDNKEKVVEPKKEEIKDNKKENQEENYTYKDIEGEYEFISDKYTESNGNEGNDRFVLSLSKNGTFHYENSFYADSGVLGNYTIEDNKLHLNILFSHGSDAAVYVTEVINKELEIKSKDELIDNNENKSQTGKVYNNITLKRNETKIEEINNLLNIYLEEIKNMIGTGR